MAMFGSSPLVPVRPFQGAGFLCPTMPAALQNVLDVNGLGNPMVFQATIGMPGGYFQLTSSLAQATGISESDVAGYLFEMSDACEVPAKLLEQFQAPRTDFELAAAGREELHQKLRVGPPAGIAQVPMVLPVKKFVLKKQMDGKHQAPAERCLEECTAKI